MSAYPRFCFPYFFFCHTNPEAQTHAHRVNTLSGHYTNGANEKVCTLTGLLWELNPGPLAPRARIIPHDQAASCRFDDVLCRRCCREHAVVCERSRRLTYTNIATQMRGLGFSNGFRSGYSSELALQSVKTDRAGNHSVFKRLR